MTTRTDAFRIEEEVETIPCGKSITIRYFDKQGTLVRQDVIIEVDKGIAIGLENGEIN